MEGKKPILSICMPTYNRADLLELSLQSIEPEILANGDEVELVISDNCSDDRTPEVVRAAQRRMPLVYHRNDKNIGGFRNYCLLPNELARGEYCWILGDDDMVLRGKLARVVATLRENQDLGYFFVNYSLETVEKRNALIAEMDSVYEPNISDCICCDGENRRLGTWEELFDIDCSALSLLFTGLPSNILRRQAWQEKTPELRFRRPLINGSDGKVDSMLVGRSLLESSVDELFPHVKVIALASAGRPAYYIGEPCWAMGQGGQEWHSEWPLVLMVGVNDALDLYERLGVSKERMKRLWRSFFTICARRTHPFRSRRQVPAVRRFPLERVAWRNRRHGALLAEVVACEIGWKARTWLSEHLPAAAYAGLRVGWRSGRHLALKAMQRTRRLRPGE